MKRGKNYLFFLLFVLVITFFCMMRNTKKIYHKIHYSFQNTSENLVSSEKCKSFAAFAESYLLNTDITQKKLQYFSKKALEKYSWIDSLSMHHDFLSELHIDLQLKCNLRPDYISENIRSFYLVEKLTSSSILLQPQNRICNYSITALKNNDLERQVKKCEQLYEKIQKSGSEKREHIHFDVRWNKRFYIKKFDDS